MSVCQSCQSSVSHTIEPTHLSVCHWSYTSVHQMVNMTSPSVCQPHDTSVHHTNIMTGPSICLSYQSSDHHTITMACPSVWQSNHSSVCHTTTLTSPSLCQSRIPSVCHTIIPTSPSVCQLQDSSVCQPTHDVKRTTVWLTVCLLSVTSILPSANSMVKIPMSIPVHKFPHALNLRKLPSIHTSTDSSVHHTGSPSVSSSLSAANPLKFPCNYGRKMW